MDAGLAAVLSGAITGTVASVGAFVTYRVAKNQARSNAQLALREPRRKIYSDFLTASREAEAAVFGLVEDYTWEAPAGPVNLALEERLPRLRHLLADVDLEGPDEVSEAAHVVVGAFSKLNGDAWVMFETGEPSDDETGRPLGFSGDFTADAREGMKRFVVVGRKALQTDADQPRERRPGR